MIISTVPFTGSGKDGTIALTKTYQLVLEMISKGKIHCDRIQREKTETVTIIRF